MNFMNSPHTTHGGLKLIYHNSATSLVIYMPGFKSVRIDSKDLMDSTCTSSTRIDINGTIDELRGKNAVHENLLEHCTFETHGAYSRAMRYKTCEIIKRWCSFA